ncbi:MAG: hypothetical protein LAT68_14250 [Cyclobacteriaceae bacterium]|nr:hypothetical protein [Cyclobacteriaceae bacterium]
MAWTVERQSEVSTAIRVEYERKTGWEQWGLLSADRHIDNVHSDLSLQRLHLDQAKERNAFVIDIGDLFCAMQGKGDRRSSKSDLRIENKDSHYLNSLVEFAHNFMRPYLENLALLAEGNHETAITKHNEYSLLDGLVYALRQGGSNVVRGGYRGYVRFYFEPRGGGKRMSRLAYYHHGHGGGGPVSKGIIQASRKAVYMPDADYVWTGHIHEQWSFPIERVRLLASGKEIRDTQHHLQLPTYKDEYTNQGGGYHHETGKPPKPIGAWWIRFYYSTRTGRVEAQFLPADL